MGEVCGGLLPLTNYVFFWEGVVEYDIIKLVSDYKNYKPHIETKMAVPQLRSFSKIT